MPVLGGWKGGTGCSLRRERREQLGALSRQDLFLREVVDRWMLQPRLCGRARN